MTELSKLVQEENGKTFDEARRSGKEHRTYGIWFVRCRNLFPASGWKSAGVECRTEHAPFGVVASIVPFNFQ